MPSDDAMRPKRESAESKAETTKRVSQELTRAATERREAKTAKLRAARLAQEENQQEQPIVKSRRKTPDTSGSK
ncbi:hypothetical protein IWQ48_001026 [Labrenzia sp. EL_13]|nr:hypothetical protein [Labrenzia sp. EL_13]